MICEPARNSLPASGSNTSGLRPTSWTGQPPVAIGGCSGCVGCQARWWKIACPPTVRSLSVSPMSSTESVIFLTSIHLIWRSSVNPVSTAPIGLYQSGATAAISTPGEETIKSGSPICHSSAGANSSGGGMSGRVAARRAVVHPCGNLRDFLVGERHVVLELLDADSLVDEPGRHDVHPGAKPRAVLDGPRPRPHFFIRDQVHT